MNKLFFRSVAFYTLGCKLNFSETSTIERQFLNKGYLILNFKEKSDIYVINTCSVTENADKEFKRIVRIALKINPNAFIIAIGCYAQINSKNLSNIYGVDLVLGSSEKFKILDYISDISKKKIGEFYSCGIENSNFYVDSYSINNRTRSFLKIQDGCDYKCSYCIIPFARGISRSTNISKIFETAKKIVKSGVKEIVLTGVNIGDYGKIYNSKHENTFLDLIKRLDLLEGIDRLRISSIEPNLLSNKIIEFIASSNIIMPHFHVPLQSGSNYILRKMRRRYTSEFFYEKIKKIKSIIPQACIGSDIIVGFPGEDEEKFIETYNFIKNIEISYLNIFTYSERINTEAIKMKEIIPKNIRYERNKILRDLSIKKKYKFYKSQIGKKFKVLFEEKGKKKFSYGYTENYIKVESYNKFIKTNSIKNVFLKKINSNGIMIADCIE